MSSVQGKTDIKLNQMLLRYVECALPNWFREEHVWPQEQDIITPLGMDEVADWVKCYVLVQN